MRLIAALALLHGCLSTAIAATPADAVQPAASWGAIASRPGAYGYAFNHASREAAERAARAQCERMAGRAGSCGVRVSFDRACGALATGNFGEWGAASGATTGSAGKAAIAQCEGLLPTEPCKVVTSVCSGR
ncbi:DUF4189 domain-containing protein [Variovorax sp. J22P271]|uniref:DUF4189 domain-containing protein n=1 Tax=Variovorax davisae TaxID=3053515 RepID=UPI0025765177|nr:DUF4189 domain-containing protein [Variovorax sp. J22P271]MDM0034455.1 DUF4189 domain-containing protein [Variovorax sp. J22P271]